MLAILNVSPASICIHPLATDFSAVRGFGEPARRALPRAIRWSAVTLTVRFARATQVTMPPGETLPDVWIKRIAATLPAPMFTKERETRPHVAIMPETGTRESNHIST
jgi:hypothetical protein